MDNKLLVMIVDDELPARQELNYLLENNFGDKIEIIGEAEHGWAAVEKINELKPQVVFLDINMPGISGLEVAQIVLEVNPNMAIVFITAFDGYALKAFEMNAIDYLVKPFNLSRLEKTIARLWDKKAKSENSQNKIEELIKQLDSLLLKPKINKIPCEEAARIILVKPEEIYYCTAEDGKSYVITKQGKLKTFYTLNELEDRLGFFRTHRSFLVNLDYIHIVEPWFHSSYRLILDDQDKTEIPVSRIQSKRLREILGL